MTSTPYPPREPAENPVTLGRFQRCWASMHAAADGAALFTAVTALRGPEMTLTAWQHTQHAAWWARQFWELLLAKLAEVPGDKPVGLLGLSASAGLLADLAGVPLSERQAARTRLQQTKPYGALLAASILDEDFEAFMRTEDWATNPERVPLTATWLLASLGGVHGAPSVLVEQNKRRAMALLDRIGRHARFFQPQAAFLDSYMFDGPETYACLRQSFIDWAREHGLLADPAVHPARSKPRGATGRPRVGIVSGNWRKGHAAYRALARQVYALKDRFDIVLVNINGVLPPDDTGQFSAVVDVKLTMHHGAGSIGIGVDDTALLEAKLDVLYFVETFSQELDSLLLLRRYAPVQVTGYGTMSSTRSPFMDWYLVGDWAEPETRQPHYSERVCHVPGLGMLSSARTPSTFDFPDGKLRVVSAASQLKFRLGYLTALRHVLQGVEDKARLLMLPNRHDLDSLWARREVVRTFGAQASKLEYGLWVTDQYQSLIGGAAVLLDSFPFCGYTTLMDAISHGTPVVTYEGFGAFGRAGAGIARAVGLPAWTIARTPTQYVDAACRLVLDDSERNRLRELTRQAAALVFQEGQETALGDALSEILRRPAARHLRVGHAAATPGVWQRLGLRRT